MIEKPKYNKKLKQVFTLYTSMILSLVVGVCVSVFNTRFLGPEQFGNYKFIQALFNFSVLFFTLGFFTTGSYMLAQKKNDSVSSELTGSIISLSMIISVAFIVTIFGFSFFQGKIFDNDLDGYIRLFSPLLFVFPFQLCLTNILQGTNRIFELSIFRLAPSILYLVVAVSMTYFLPFSLFYALLILFATHVIVILFLLDILKPSFKNIKQHLRNILLINKNYGFPVYVGTLANVASAQLGSLSVAFFVDNINVGYFSLAITITAPLMMIPSVVGTTFFKEFSNSSSIPKNVVFVTLLLSIITLGGFLAIAEWGVVSLYSAEYLNVVSLSYILSFGSVLHGFGDLVNRFLGAHGHGKYLRNGSMAAGIVNLFGYVLFVRHYGITGAALTRLFAGLTYLAMMVFYYWKLKKKT